MWYVSEKLIKFFLIWRSKSIFFRSLSYKGFFVFLIPVDQWYGHACISVFITRWWRWTGCIGMTLWRSPSHSVSVTTRVKHKIQTMASSFSRFIYSLVWNNGLFISKLFCCVMSFYLTCLGKQESFNVSLAIIMIFNRSQCTLPYSSHRGQNNSSICD